MYDTYFYNSTIRKIVALFGDMFNQIQVARPDGNGNLVNQRRVPLSYGPQESFLARINERPDLTDERVAIVLPRMSYEISGSLLYDAERQISKNVRCVVQNAEGNSVGVMSPAPYNIPFQLSVYSRTQDEVLQIVEQILPYFKPSITRKYFPITGQTWTDEVTFILNNVSVEDTFNNDFEDNRVVIYTLDFDARINIYGFISSASEIIKNSVVRFTNSNNEPQVTLTQSVNPQTAEESDPHTVDISVTLSLIHI